ncbi:MAG: helicase HerA-like domain-containing protein [Acidimicrobiales bacterium]
MLDGTTHPDAVVQVPLAMCNRHGLIAGATGTGKTVTLQLLAEQLSSAGVPVFTADIKGDLSGLVKAATPGERITRRVEELELQYTPAGSPVQFWALGGEGPGVPVRASVSSFGPQLLAKVLGANETQTSSLSLVFYYADQQGLPLLDLVDLVDLLKFLVSDEGKAELKGIGGLSSQTAGVLLRKLVELLQQDAELFFGEPEVTVADLMRVDADGRGVVSCLELADVQDRPKLFSTFLMWLLAELFEHLPEAGDLDQPKLVFFFDEAHLLFDGASKEFVDQVAQTVRLIRSKGVGVFFVTQLPDDVPDEVLAQLGNRVQHGCGPTRPGRQGPQGGGVDLSEDRRLRPRGGADPARDRRGHRDHAGRQRRPTPVAWTKVRPPQSQIGAVDPAEVLALAQASEPWATYVTEVDRESARELLAARMGVTLPPPTPAPTEPPVVRPDLPRLRPGRTRPSRRRATWCGTRASTPRRSTRRPLPSRTAGPRPDRRARPAGPPGSSRRPAAREAPRPRRTTTTPSPTS